MNIFPVGDRTKNNKLCISCLLLLSQKLGIGLLRLKIPKIGVKGQTTSLHFWKYE